MKKIIFFIADTAPTNGELEQIELLNKLKSGYEIVVRNAQACCEYGAEREYCDLVAGAIPEAFEKQKDYGYASDNKPVMMKVTGAIEPIGVGGFYDLKAIAVYGYDISELEIEDLTNDPRIQWQSEHPDIVSVDANGRATAIAAGTSRISVVFEFESNFTVTTGTVMVVAG